MAETDDELAAISDRLYSLRPDAFAAARDEEVRKARSEGKQALARELAKLRRPTQSAWLINLLWRDQGEVLEQLFELAGELSRAQAQSAGQAMQRLTQQRRQLESALIRRGRELAEAQDVHVSAAMEREAQETLAAALAQPEVAEEIRSGQLVKPASYAGFGTMAVPAATPRDAPAGAAKAQAPPAKIERLDERAAQRARERREEAERRVQEARAAAENAAHELDDHTRALEEARKQERALGMRIDRAREELHRLEEEAADAERSVFEATRRRDQAEHAQESARTRLELAEEYLNELQRH